MRQVVQVGGWVRSAKADTNRISHSGPNYSSLVTSFTFLVKVMLTTPVKDPLIQTLNRNTEPETFDLPEHQDSFSHA